MINHTGLEELGGSFRAFLDEAQSVFGASDGDARLRASLIGPRPFVALAFLMCRSPDFRARYVAEILEAICGGPSTSLVLARDVLRCLPRSTLERSLPALVDRKLASADEQQFSRLFEIVVELRLSEVAAVVRERARSHLDQEVREMGESLDGAEGDDARWGHLVSEWPIRDAR